MTPYVSSADVISESCFPVSIGENEAAGIRKKPAPDTVFTALERLGSTVEHAVYIGDSEVDAADSPQCRNGLYTGEAGDSESVNYWHHTIL